MWTYSLVLVVSILIVPVEPLLSDLHAMDLLTAIVVKREEDEGLVYW